MKSRRQAREVVLKTLYRMETTQETPQEAFEDISSNWSKPVFDRDYALRLLRGVASLRRELDTVLRNIVKNWDIKRIAIIDKNILRIAIYEILYLDDIPPKVSMDEAIEIAKIYSTADSSKFVNGILDKVLKRKELTGKRKRS